MADNADFADIWPKWLYFDEISKFLTKTIFDLSFVSFIQMSQITTFLRALFMLSALVVSESRSERFLESIEACK